MYLAAAFADQPDDNHIGIRIAGQHGHHGRFADTGTRENTHPLAAANRCENIDAFDLCFQLLAHFLAVECTGWVGAKAGFAARAARAGILRERAAKRINHRADPAVVGGHHIVMLDQFDGIPDGHALPCAERQNA